MSPKRFLQALWPRPTFVVTQVVDYFEFPSKMVQCYRPEFGATDMSCLCMSQKLKNANLEVTSMAGK